MKIQQLQFDPKNANKGTERGRKALAESLKQYGAGRSILVDKKGRVIAGNKTLEQAIAAGHKDILVVKTDGSKLVAVQRMDLDLKDKRAKALAIADNRVSELDLEWDEAVLAELGKEIDLSAFWTSGELEKLLGITAGEAPEPQLDKAAELQKKWKTKLGQMWAIGEHRLLCGDSTNKQDVARVMGKDGHCEAVVTDPPYGIDRKGITNDSPEGLPDLFAGVLANMPISNAVVIAFQSPRLFPVWLDASRKAGHEFERALWFYDETDVTFPWRGWLMTSQIALVSSVGKPRWKSDGPYHHDCYVVKTAGKQNDSGGHTTAKPLDIIADLIAHTHGGIYEPFCGSGTAIVAAEQLNRPCYAIEIEPKYVAVALERLEAMGLKPKLA